jgi:hypothetical protein
MPLFARRLRRFRDEEDGLIFAEFLIMLPLLLWTFMALFIYWDAFRTINQAQKAAYSVSDLISRQSEVTVGFLDGLEVVTEYLMNDSPGVSIRITSLEWREDEDAYRVIFSYSPGNKMPTHTPTTLMAIKEERIPDMADNHGAVIVETTVDYDPAINIGIPNHSFDNFVITRPRYDRLVCLTTAVCPTDL